MNENDVEEFLAVFDSICLVAMSQGLTPAAISGAVLARVQQLYLSDGLADLDGLAKLLRYSLELIENRPQWKIE